MHRRSQCPCPPIPALTANHRQDLTRAGDLYGPDSPDDAHRPIGDRRISPIAQRPQGPPDGGSHTAVHRLSTGTLCASMTRPLKFQGNGQVRTLDRRSRHRNQTPDLRITSPIGVMPGCAARLYQIPFSQIRAHVAVQLFASRATRSNGVRAPLALPTAQGCGNARANSPSSATCWHNLSRSHRRDNLCCNAVGQLHRLLTS